MQSPLLLLLSFQLFFTYFVTAKLPAGAELIQRVDDLKEFQKLLRTKKNVLVVYAESLSSAKVREFMQIAASVTDKIYGKGVIATVDCTTEEGKKTCKKQKSSPKPILLRHYHNGQFNKDYDRAKSAASLTRFMLDPTGDLPWEEDPMAMDIVHIADGNEFRKLLKRTKGGVLAMFYAPWCGHCKRMKPDFGILASEFKDKQTLVAVDATLPDNADIVAKYNVTGFPTILYFERGELAFPYNGDRSKADLTKFLQNPIAQPEAKESESEANWSDEESEVKHLTEANFAQFIAENPSVLVMFYAPWCGHCKRMKPDYTMLAGELKTAGIPGFLAAVDATKAEKLAKEYNIGGFPTLKYFKDGKFAWDFNERSNDKIREFMQNPTEPPPPPPPEPEWDEVESDVKHLTDANFKSELKGIRHALVIFYAPWCGHCKAAKPEFTRAAAHFRDEPRVGLYAVDCTKWKPICSQFDVSGFPTFKYLSYGKLDQPYNGGRLESDFVGFLQQKSGVKAEL